MSNAEVGNLKVSLSMNSANFQQSLTSIDRSIKTLGQEMSIVRNKGKEWGNTTEGLRAKQETLTRLLSSQEAKVRNLRAAYERSKQETGENSAATERLAAQLNRAVAEYTRTETEIRDVTDELRRQEAELERAQSKWQRAGESMQRVGETMQKVGSKMKSIGQSMSLYVTAPIVAMAGGAVKAAIDFESAFAGVRKTVDTSEAGFKKLETGIREMSKTLPTSASDIAAVAESAGQLGIAEDNILGFTRTIIDLGESTNLTREQAATEFARFANITGMSQKDFDKLGSSIVALGNNYATTESEISAMAMRLAGQGKQVKMSESDILALAATMSSLGIEAEAGGTAMSTVLKKMQTAVAANGKYLELYAKTAGVTGAEFKKAFETDAAGALDLFVKGLAKSSGEGENLTEILSILGIKGIRESDTLLRMAGASDLLSGAVKTSSDAWKENTALSNEAEQRYKTTASQLSVLKNKLVDVGITIGNILIPVMMQIVDKITPVIEGFSKMGEGTQKFILIAGGIVAAIGPILIVVGMLVSSIGTIVTAFGVVSTAIAGAGGAMGALGVVMTTLTGPIGLAVGAIATIGTAALLVAKDLKKPSLESKVFGDSISEGTQKAVGGFLELNDKATVALDQLSWSGKKVTKDMATGIISTFDEMGNQILSEMKTDHTEQLKNTQDFFSRSNTLSKTEEAKIVENVKKSQEEQQQKVTDGQNRVKEILTTAKNEKRAITDAERTEINKIQEEMKTTAVKVMSQSEAEQKAILASLKAEASKITAEQAAEVVKNSKKQKDEVVKDANAQYKESVAEIIRMRDESKVITADQADKLINEAKRQKDGMVKEAVDTHEKVVSEAQKQADEHVNKVDWETGEIKSKWQALKDDITNQMTLIGTAISLQWDKVYKATTESLSNTKEAIVTKLGEWKTSITDWFSSIPDVISTKIGEWKTAISEWFTTTKEGITTKLSEWGTAISEWFTSIPSVITTKLTKWAASITNWFITTKENIVTKLAEWEIAIAKWFSSMPDVIVAKLTEWGTAIKNWAIEQNEENKRQFAEWGAAIAVWFSSMPTKISNKLAEWQTAISEWFTAAKENIATKLVDWGAAIFDWFTTTKENIATKLGEWVASITNWFITTKENIVTKLADWSASILVWFTSMPGKISEKFTEWGTAVSKWFTDTKENITTKLEDWSKSISKWFSDMPGKIGKLLDGWWTKMSTWFSEIPAKITAKFEEWWKAIKEWFTSVPEKPEIKNMGKNLIDKVSDGTNEKKPEFMDKLGEIIFDVAKGALMLATVALIATGREIIKRIIEGVTAMKNKLTDKAKELMDSFKNKVAEIDLIQVGKDVIAGFVNGVTKKIEDVVKAAKSVGRAFLDAMDKTLDRNSPSKETEKRGKDTGQGFVNGIAKKEKDIENAAKKAATKALKSFNTKMQKLDLKLSAGTISTKKYTESLKKMKQEYKYVTNATEKLDAKIAKASTKKAAEEQRKRQQLAAKLQKEFNTKMSNSDLKLKAGKINTVEYEKSLLKIKKDYATLPNATAKVDAKITAQKSKMSATQFKRDKVDYAAKKKDAEVSMAEELAILNTLSKHYKKKSDERIHFENLAKQKKQEITAAKKKINEDYLKNVQELNQKLIDGEKQLKEEYKKAVDDRAKSLYSFAGLFDEVAEKAEVSGQKLIDNLKGQIDAFSVWSDNLKALGARGLDKGLLSELEQMGPSAAAEIAALTTLSDEQLTQYTDLWREKSKLAHDQAVGELEGMRIDTANKIDQLNRDTKKQLKEYQTEWKNSMQTVTRNTKSELSVMPDIGSYAVQGLIDGMNSRKSELERIASELAAIVAGTVKNDLGIHSPSRVFKGFGINVNEGFIQGIQQSTAKLKQALASTYNGMASTAQSMMGMTSVSNNTHSTTELKTVNYNTYQMTYQSPKPLDPYEASRMTRNSLKELGLQL